MSHYLKIVLEEFVFLEKKILEMEKLFGKELILKVIDQPAKECCQIQYKKELTKRNKIS